MSDNKAPRASDLALSFLAVTVKEYVVIYRILSKRKTGAYLSKKAKLFLVVNFFFGIFYKK